MVKSNYLRRYPSTRGSCRTIIGGAWMAQALAPHFDKYLGSDIVPDLVLLYNALLDGWNPPP